MLAPKSKLNWGDLTFRVIKKEPITVGGVTNTYYMEELGNKLDTPISGQFRWNKKWACVSHEVDADGFFNYTIPAGETVVLVAKYINPRTRFSWGLYHFYRDY